MVDLTIGVNQDGDNAEGSVITSPESATPSVALAPDVSNVLGWNWCMCTFNGATGKTPVFTFPKATFDTGRLFQNATFGVTNPYFSYNGIDWTPFDNRSLVSTDLQCSHNSAFTGYRVQIALHRPYTWTKLRYLMDNVWGVHDWVSATPSGIAYSGSYVLGETPADVDLSTAARTIPAQEFCGFKIAHPDFVGTTRRNMVITAGMHIGEYLGEESLIAFIADLLGADPDAADVRYQNAYEVLRYFDVYCYPMNNPGHYVSMNRAYDGGIVTGYDPGSQWHSVNAQIHEPLRDAIETDITLNGVKQAEVVLDFHSSKGTSLIEAYYQITTRPDTYNGDDSVWFTINGVRRYWYQYLLAQIIPTAVNASSNNQGAIRQYARDNWLTKVATSIEVGQDANYGTDVTSDVAKAAMHMVRQMVENSRTNVPRPSGKGKFR